MAANLKLLKWRFKFTQQLIVLVEYEKNGMRTLEGIVEFVDWVQENLELGDGEDSLPSWAVEMLPDLNILSRLPMLCENVFSCGWRSWNNYIAC